MYKRTFGKGGALTHVKGPPTGFDASDLKGPRTASLEYVHAGATRRCRRPCGGQSRRVGGADRAGQRAPRHTRGRRQPDLGHAPTRPDTPAVVLLGGTLAPPLAAAT